MSNGVNVLLLFPECENGKVASHLACVHYGGHYGVLSWLLTHMLSATAITNLLFPSLSYFLVYNHLIFFLFLQTCCSFFRVYNCSISCQCTLVSISLMCIRAEGTTTIVARPVNLPIIYHNTILRLQQSVNF